MIVLDKSKAENGIGSGRKSVRTEFLTPEDLYEEYRKWETIDGNYYAQLYR